MSDPNPRYYRCENWIVNFEHVLAMTAMPYDITKGPPGRYTTVLTIPASREQPVNFLVPNEEVDLLFAAFEQWLSQR